MAAFFDGIERIAYGGPNTDHPLAFRWYDPDRIILGKRMEDHLRFAVCWWHSFAWDGSDVFGGGTFDRPWTQAGADPMAAALAKMDAAFEFFDKLGVPFFCFHDVDVAPPGETLGASQDNFARLVDAMEERMDTARARLLWGTANLFSHPRYAAGAATNPDPEVFACAALQVRDALEATHRLGGANYVLWGGREGYETLLNTDLKRESTQLARFLHLVAEHKHRIGFQGTLLIEPKPHEPTKHQYDYDCAAVHAFLVAHGLEAEYKLNIEVNHAELAGHSFVHELSYAAAHDLLGSVDANRGDPQNGWDTDQFPLDPLESTLAMAVILNAGGFSTGGFNFDAKLRRQSLSRDDLFHAHIGGMDTLARALIKAADLIEQGTLADALAERYAGWNGPLGQEILEARADLSALAERARSDALDPRPRSGRQEYLETVLARTVLD